ncbi:hypothetical protein FOCC_FOCC001384 [Frankliniella occidentalis]|nr:hypothetical protein FOCC_FOCC001384 [Frankliniella occidentalis]
MVKFSPKVVCSDTDPVCFFLCIAGAVPDRPPHLSFFEIKTNSPTLNATNVREGGREIVLERDGLSMEQPDPDYIKMFVGQLPRSMDEADLTRLFEEFGRVHQINVLRDKNTGQSKATALPSAVFELCEKKTVVNEEHVYAEVSSNEYTSWAKSLVPKKKEEIRGAGGGGASRTDARKDKKLMGVL